jgi:hypothetical protein
LKQDRLSALRQRLKRGSFEFGALLEGVSTLDEPRVGDEGRRTTDDGRRTADEGRWPSDSHPAPELNLVPPGPEPVHVAEPVIEEVEIVEEVIAGVSITTADDLDDPFLDDPFLDDPLSLFETEAAVDPQSAIRTPQLDRIRVALDSLGCRFLQ